MLSGNGKVCIIHKFRNGAHNEQLKDGLKEFLWIFQAEKPASNDATELES